MSNSSSLNEFLLLTFADTQELQLLHFALFLGIYPADLLGNGLIITAVACDHHLHTPMYFFLFKLSLLDLDSISVTVPKSRSISCGTPGPFPTGDVLPTSFCFSSFSPIAISRVSLCSVFLGTDTKGAQVSTGWVRPCPLGELIFPGHS
uniref:Uncharacterized protein n=1 Tax=Apteryx owenii TaxID=8824 RepID=A0A8B9PUI3_APTOW